MRRFQLSTRTRGLVFASVELFAAAAHADRETTGFVLFKLLQPIGPSSPPSSAPAMGARSARCRASPIRSSTAAAGDQSATSRPRAMKRDRDSGTIEAGKMADMIVVAGDPLADLRALRATVTVVTAGRAYETAKLWRLVGFTH